MPTTTTNNNNSAGADIKRPIIHTLTLTVAHGFNALPRIVGLFSGRGYNIETISLGEAEEPNTARVTITTKGDQHIIEQIVGQLEKLVDVIEVRELTFESFVEREMALIKLDAPEHKRAEIMQVTSIFRANIVDISEETLTVEATGSRDKVSAAISMLRPFGLREVARTGTVAMKREFETAPKITLQS